VAWLNKRQRLLAWWSGVSLVVVIATVVWSVSFGREVEQAVLPGAEVEGLTSVLSRAPHDTQSSIRFRDVAPQAGLNFRHFPARRASLLPEDMGSGVACGDFDGDGFVDLFLVNFAGPAIPDTQPDPVAGRSRLYRNIDGRQFEDVTQSAGIGFVGLGMAAGWGDYDNDGDEDLYITAFGDNALYENLGNGTFQDVTERSGTQDGRFSAGCAWADYDRDGDLDLYVCNYVNFVFRESDRNIAKEQYSTEQPYTLNPSAYAAWPNALFRNRGDGTFEDVAKAAGVADPRGKSLEATWVDFDNDGWPDLYVANDVSNNGVFRNLGDGTFEDVGPGSLAADYRGAMGMAASDFDNDLDQDLFITHWIAQENALYRNMLVDGMLGDSKDRRLWFMDEADRFGLGQSSLDMVGWATGFADFDNDGQRDLWVVNGSTLEEAANHSRLSPQPPFVMWNRGDKGFYDVAAEALGDAAQPFVGRGGAQLDFDRDGLIDLVWIVHGGPAMLLRNQTPSPGHWLRVVLRNGGALSRAIGARAYVEAGGVTMMQEVGASSSYLSQHEPALHFGLGPNEMVDSLRIVWPDGHESTHQGIAVDREHVLEHTPDYSSLTN
jgi:hypothetical protein